MHSMKWGLKPHSRKSIACMVVLIMLFSMLGLGNPGLATAKSGETTPATEFAVVINDNGEEIPVHTYTIAEMEALSVSDVVYYSSIDSQPMPVITKAKGVILSSLVTDINANYNANVTIGADTLKSIRLHATDDSSSPYLYNYLFGSPRYYYPRIGETWDSENLVPGEGCTDNPVPVEPMFAVTSYQARSDQFDSSQPLDGTRTFRFCFGQTENDITNSNATTGRFLRGVNKMEIILPEGPEAPALSPDIVENTVGNDVEITFDETQTTWQDAIHIVRVEGNDLGTDKYSIVAGKITIDSSLFTEAKNYSIYIKARNYKAATVTQSIEAGTTPELKNPPALTADSSDNTLENPIDITFTEDESWRNAITGVQAGATVLQADQYDKSAAGKITISAGVLPAGSHNIVIKATDYNDATVTQTIQAAPEIKNPPVLNADSDNIMGEPIEITFADNEAWCNAITEVWVGDTQLQTEPNLQYTIEAGKITIIPELFPEAGTYTITIKAENYTHAAIEQEVQDATGNVNDFNYTISEGKATITGYIGTGTEVVIPSTVNHYGTEYPVTAIIGNSKAVANTSVTTVSFAEPCNVTSIGDYAFYNYKALASINIPETVTNIGMCSFRNCSALTSLQIPSSVTSFGLGPFLGSGITSLELPNNLTSIPDYLYYGTQITSVEIPSHITSIGNYAFGSCTKLTSIVIPSGIISIGDSAFASCTALTAIEIPDSVTSIGKSPFKGAGITSVKLPASMTNIPDEFYVGLKLTSIEIPSGITGIGNNAFKDCTTLSAVTFAQPCNVKSIGESAFMGCRALTSIEIPCSVTSIGNGSFRNCSTFSTLSFVQPSNLQSIGEFAFHSTALVSIELPGHLISIGKFAFGNCKSLISVSFAKPSRLSSIGDYAFGDCNKLNNIMLPGSLTRIGNSAFRSCTALTSIEIPGGITSLADKAFSNCTALNTITLHDGLESIGANAFENTIFPSIEIPATVKSIGSNAFLQNQISPKVKAAYFFGPQPSGVSFPWKHWSFKLYYHVKYADSWENFITYKAKEKFCKLTIDSQDYSAPKTSYATVNADGNVTLTEPTREFYTFGGWYKDANCTDHFSPFNEEVIDDLTLYAKWIPTADGRVITFSIGGETYKNVTAAPDSTIDAPAAPVKTGYTFDGWYTDANCTTPAEFPYTVTENAALYGKWVANGSVSVTFMSDGAIHSTQSALVGTAIDAPAAPVKEGYTLDGWYADEGFATEVAFPFTVENDTTLYARWIINYNITLMSEGQIYGTIEAASDSKIAAPAAVKEGYTLDGWFFNEECTNAVTFPYSVEKDTTMYAKWTINYKITLMDGTAIFETMEKPSGLQISAPAAVKDGYKFEGWYLDEAFAEAVTFPYTVEKDITMYGKWTAIDYSITIVDSITGGSVTADKTKANIGDTIILTINPDPVKRLRAGSLQYTTNGTQYMLISGNSFTMPAANVTITAVFVTIPVNGNVWDGSTDTSWYNKQDKNITISSPAELAGLAAIVNGTADGIVKDEFAGKTIALTADIDLGGVQNRDGSWDAASIRWTSIGGGVTESQFRGTFDGGGHIISNLYINHLDSGWQTEAGKNQGLFGMNSGTIKNLGVTGFVGANRSVAGLVGKNFGRIESCFNAASVIGTDSKGVGGITGANWGIGPEIINCYNTGSVHTQYGTGLAGGLAGDNERIVTNCYNIGKISSDKSPNVGGIVGNIKGNYGISVTDCYYSNELNDKGIGKYDATKYTESNVEGKTAEEMKSADILALLNGENDSAFVQDTGNINNGFPVLSWQSTRKPQYTVTVAQDAAYIIGETQDGIKTMTVNEGQSGLKYFGVSVSPMVKHQGNETVVFTHWRNGTEVEINATIADFDVVDNAKSGFNVQPGDVIKVYVVDCLSNAVDSMPIILQ